MKRLLTSVFIFSAILFSGMVQAQNNVPPGWTKFTVTRAHVCFIDSTTGKVEGRNFPGANEKCFEIILPQYCKIAIWDNTKNAWAWDFYHDINTWETAYEADYWIEKEGVNPNGIFDRWTFWIYPL